MEVKDKIIKTIDKIFCYLSLNVIPNNKFFNKILFKIGKLIIKIGNQ
jgi:hypothetical protein